MNRTIIYCLAAVAVMGAACAAGSLFFRETPQPQTYTPHATISPGSGTLSADNADDAPITTPPTTVVFDTRAQQRMEAIASDYRFEGVAIAVKDGKLISRYAAGVADYESYAPITEDSLFCVGSLAKQFTATCILMLEERGKLSVNDALGKYFPECPYGDDVTLRNLLTMRSGIAEFYETYNDGYSQNEIPAGTLAETVTNENTAEDNRNQLEQWLFAQPLVFEPGSQCVYTNSNYFLLARLVERLSGRSYEDFVRANIFEPLGMTSSGFIDELLDDPRLAKDAREAHHVAVPVLPLACEGPLPPEVGDDVPLHLARHAVARYAVLVHRRRGRGYPSRTRKHPGLQLAAGDDLRLRLQLRRGGGRKHRA